MPKAGTVTLQIEPIAVLHGVGWLIRQRPYDNPKLFIAVLPEEERQTREYEYICRVNEIARQCLKWLRRTPASATLSRIETPFEKHGFNMPRETAIWLGAFWRPRRGLFSAKRKERDPATDWFFLSCHLAANKKMGRPTLTREALEQRTTGEVGDHYNRFMRDRRRLERMPTTNALLALKASSR